MRSHIQSCKLVHVSGIHYHKCVSSTSGCVFVYFTVKVKVKVTQLCPTLGNSMDYTVHGILQARILEWVAFPFSRGSSQPRDRTQVSCIAGRFFTSWATREAPRILEWAAYPFFSRSSWPRYWTSVSCIAGGFYTNWDMRETLPLW